MQRTIRISALLLALFLLSSALVSCASSENERAVGSVGEYEILYDELRFVTLSYKEILDATYGDGIADNGTIWDDPTLSERYLPELKTKVMTMLEQNYRVLLACAAYGIGKDVLESKEIQSEVDRQFESAVKSYPTKKDFLDEMESNGMSERLYRFYLAREQMKYKLRDAVLADENADIIRDQQSFHTWLTNGNCVYVQHVFLRNDPDDDVEFNRRRAEEISVMLQNKEKHINELVGNGFFNEDLTNVAPYYLIPYLFDESLVVAGLRLYDVGDASDVIETEEGFWVLQRIEEPTGELDKQIGDLFDAYIWAKLGMDPTQGVKIEITFNDYGNSLDLTTVK